MSLDWKAIHPLNGSQDNAFEELCAQLARAETPSDAQFNRKGVPDAGVECFCTLPDGTEWGWQAKYFDALGNSQWSQLDDSIKRALSKHPALVTYYVCVPMDRPDARIPGRKSAMERWDEHVQKWTSWAQDLGRTVDFVWWGSSELIDRLSKQSECGRLLFWFGEVEFNKAWFSARLQEAIRGAGPRYTPELHVELEIVQRMAAFARTVDALDRVKALARDLRREFRAVAPAASENDDPLNRLNLRGLPQLGKVLFEQFAALESSPIDEVPFLSISDSIGQVESIADEVLEDLRQLERDYDAQRNPDTQAYSYSNNPYGNWVSRIYRLRRNLIHARSRLSLADQFFNKDLMILKGDAGTGKTHLLCDFASKRVEAGAPVVLLLGQWFSQQGEPWTQLLQQLGLQGKSPEQFIGALEAAGQAAKSRTLVMIDAINEGRGGEIWPAHLSSFLARLEKSPWISVVLSIRSSYEKAILPAEVVDQGAILIHEGFAGREYDAVRTYFSFYDLEFPSVPILQPEFKNPLFLKILCQGLHHRGERRIPHGFHGITAVFGLFLDAINSKLADSNRLDYDEKDPLVRKGIERVAKETIETGSRSIPRDRAQEIVDQLLPGRTYSNSLYRGLVTEGVLVEDKAWWTETPSGEVVLIAYDRFADHIVADYLLHTHLDSAEPDVAFSEAGELAFLCLEDGYVRSGLLGALSVQVPELTGQELVRLVPGLWDDTRVGEAFLESVVWRSLEAFSDETLAVFGELIEAGKIWDDLLEVLLTVSTVPRHYFNADFLDKRLRRDGMAERDAWWSTYLHRAWGEEGPIDRLVDWASNVLPDNRIEPAVVDLAATTLAWMFATPNRPLRDRATKGLVCLLTGRIESTVRLVDRFADVDDHYVLERVYAAAYGVAMRSHDAALVGNLASAVYEHVFASCNPPVHILLRDYARSIIERAFYLGAGASFDENLIRPPYNSIWPPVPSEDCVEALTPRWRKGAWEGGDLEWSRNRIRWSVMDDDFARYVIGDDFSSDWLSLGLDEEPWKSPEERKEALLLKLNEPELVAWNEYQTAKTKLPLSIRLVFGKVKDTEGDSDEVEDSLVLPIGEQTDEQDDEQARWQVEVSYGHLMSELTEDHRVEMESILSEEGEQEGREGPRFDKSLIQRYIMWRVFDLGWTIERFGQFDRFDIGYSGRDAAKPERMGKKYQWIAYHEIMAYISDHFQYRPRWGSPSDRYYRGPWQPMFRDIDPSFTLLSRPGGTSWGPHAPAWWSEQLYESWDEEVEHGEWMSRTGDIPQIKPLLQVRHPADGTRWLNVCGHFVWQQPHPADVDPFDTLRREIRLSCIGYLIKEGDADTFAEWSRSAENIQLVGPGTQDLFGVFFGEYGWAPAFKHSEAAWEDEPGPNRASDWQGFARPTRQSYHAGISSFDCSSDDGMNLSLPHPDFIGELGLQWDGAGCAYVDRDGELAAFDPTARENGPSALLLREDLVKEYLEGQGLTLCWVILGEKWAVGGERWNREFHGRLKIAGAYHHTDQGPDGDLRFQVDIPEK